MSKLLLAVGLLSMLAGGIAEARVLYVDGRGGSDRHTYEQNSADRPWATLGRAAWGSQDRDSPRPAQAARAGDTVIVRAGVYVARQTGGNRYDAAWNPVNNGQVSKPIVFRAEGEVILRSSPDSSGGPVVGANGKAHIAWDGFVIDEPNIRILPDTGPVVIWGSNHIRIENLDIRGKTAQYADNHNGIRIEGSSNIVIRGNRIHDIRAAKTSPNAAAIMLYRSTDITMEDNEIFDNDNGIYIKGFNPGPMIVRNNNIHDIDLHCLHLNKLGAADQFIQGTGGVIYGNLLRNCLVGLFFNPSINGNPIEPRSVLALALNEIKIVNNTIVNVDAGMMIRGNIDRYRDIEIRNNIFSGTKSAVVYAEVDRLTPFSMSHNLYHGIRGFGILGGRKMDFDRWRQQLGLDKIGSFVGEPGFVDPSRHDYRLNPSSEGKGAGVDLLDLRGKGRSGAVDLGALPSS